MSQTRTGAVVSIGECMVELAREPDGRFGQAFGGDTFNTAVYLARCGVRVSYATALGDDPYSGGILDLARAEGVASDLIHIAPGRMPGLYLIETNAAGERTFHYWRDRSPARDLFDNPLTDLGAEKVATAMRSAPLVVFSGITLSLYGETALDRFAAAVAAAKGAGARIAMDGNYRPRGWVGDRTRARRVMERFWRLADIALPTFDDEVGLWSDANPNATIARLTSYGIGEIALKQGPDGALCQTTGGAGDKGGRVHIAIPVEVVPVDTSAAGDSFNAAYLAARLAGTDQPTAALAGHRLAGIVIQHRGAIAPAVATKSAISVR